MKILACATCGGNCMGCFYSDECNNWNDIAPYNEAEIEVDTASMELCKGRHATPATDGAIFETEWHFDRESGKYYCQEVK